MDTSGCNQLLNIKTIADAFKNGKKELSDRIIGCFYSCYKSAFIKWASITYHEFPSDSIDFLANNSFTDAVMKLKDAAQRNELYEGQATVKTILFTYCRNILLGYLTSEKRKKEKDRKLAVVLEEEYSNPLDENAVSILAGRYEKIRRALAQLDPDDRQIIQWRHIDGKSNDEIAAKLAITVASATNRIYRCMQRLKDKIEK
jgi:RNA polymerase sigma factor (sigma-70 family)